MAYGKWIGAWLGAMSGGVLGAMAGFALGAAFDKMTEGFSENDNNGSSSARGYGNQRARQEEEARNNFLFSLMVLSAHIIQADGKIMHSEMNMVRSFLRANFGETAVKQGEDILLRLFEYRKTRGEAVWSSQIREACGEMRAMMPEEHRMQLVSFLVGIAKTDGSVVDAEVNALRDVVVSLGLNASIIDQMFSLGGQTLDDAYRVLGIQPTATDDEVRKAYRDLVKKHHPDRVSTLGEDVKEAAKRKMQAINEAKDRIYKARGI